MKLTGNLRQQPQWLILAVAITLVLLVGFFDSITGYDVSLFVLYSIPILFIVWFSGRPARVFICIFCAVVWGVADAKSGHQYKHFSILIWNTMLQLGFFGFAAFCGSALKFQLDQTQAQVAELERFHVLAEISPVGIFRTAPDGECVYVNRRWCQITGAEALHALGKPWTAALHSDDRERVASEWALPPHQRRTFQFQTRFLTPHGETVWALGHLAPERDGAGEVCGYVGTITDMTEHRRLEREILEISEREQQRIGQDLHDDLCQFLAAIQYAASSLRDDLKRRNLPEAEEAREVTALLKDAIARARGLARGIFPVQLEQLGLISALHELAAATSRLYGISCSFDHEPPILIHDSTAATHVYRIAQEALNNAIKHGHARTITIALHSRDDLITLLIRDDGTGLPGPRSEPCDGMGLRIMEYRSHMIGGTLSIGKNKRGGGSFVKCSFRRPKTPLHPPVS